MNTDGAVVRDADDCARLHLETPLDAAALAAVLRTTDTGLLVEDAGTWTGDVWLDVAVLRSRARLAATSPDWTQRWSTLLSDAERSGRLSTDGRAVRVHVHVEQR